MPRLGDVARGKTTRATASSSTVTLRSWNTFSTATCRRSRATVTRRVLNWEIVAPTTAATVRVRELHFAVR